jgi:hypothetical protein
LLESKIVVLSAVVEFSAELSVLFSVLFSILQGPGLITKSPAKTKLYTITNQRDHSYAREY